MSELQWDRNFALEQSGDDEEMLAELLRLLREASKSDFAKIKEALQNKDSQELAAAAHSIKGASASLGIEGLRQVASDLEKTGSSGDLDCALGLMSRMESLLGMLNTLK